jgi:hypothetical protein
MKRSRRGARVLCGAQAGEKGNYRLVRPIAPAGSAALRSTLGTSLATVLAYQRTAPGLLRSNNIVCSDAVVRKNG